MPRDLIVGIIEAKNSIGYSNPSSENNSGAIAMTEPEPPNQANIVQEGT